MSVIERTNEGRSDWQAAPVPRTDGRRTQHLAYLLLCIIVPGCLEEDLHDTESGSAAAAVQVTDVLTPHGVAMVVIPSGGFSMGNDSGGDDEHPRHDVRISALAIDKFEVTQDQYAELALANPSHFKGPRRPIEQVRWSDAALFCNKRSIADGLEPCYDELTFLCNFEATGYRLPTEAEWEYAARAGEQDSTSNSDTNDDLGVQAVYGGNSRAQTASAGSRRPNAWGLYDMQGNVSEWCNDIYAKDYYAHSPGINPRGPEMGKRRVLRGGSWKSTQDTCRLTARLAGDSGISAACATRDTYGLRCVRRLANDEQP